MPALIRSNDRKVANSVTASGNVRIANTYGLPSGKEYSCPGATKFCESVCYAGKIEKYRKSVKAVLMHNWKTLQACGDDEVAIYQLLDQMINQFVADCERKGAEKLFRIHWDGDFYSDAYTRAWGATISAYPDVQFWVYTRVPSAVEILQGLGNLSLYFSSDPDNREIGNELRDRFDIKLAYLALTFEEGKTDMQMNNRRGTPCPENKGTLPLISTEGSACVRCAKCVFAKSDVLFSASKK